MLHPGGWLAETMADTPDQINAIRGPMSSKINDLCTLIKYI